jgi:hypothetical protein
MKLARAGSTKDASLARLPRDDEADDVDFGAIQPRVIGTAEHVVRARVVVDERHA